LFSSCATSASIETATALSEVFSASSLSSSTFFSKASMSCSNSRKTRFAMMVDMS